MEVGNYNFCANFDSGNLLKVEEVDGEAEDGCDTVFNIWSAPDCHQTKYQSGNTTSWFYFSFSGGNPGENIKFNIQNFGRQVTLFSKGMKPVVKYPNLHWKRVDNDPVLTEQEDSCVLSFRLKNAEQFEKRTFLAFTYPYSYTSLQDYLCNLEKNRYSKTHFQREIIAKSKEGRNLDLVTIKKVDKDSSMSTTRPIVFISARVHPGEVCSSFVVQGFMNFLLDEINEDSEKLLDKYEFKIVPMLNPDGVARGHYRHDTTGTNLNRVYDNPSNTDTPTIFAVKTLLDELKSKIFFYTDIHGHAIENGAFIFGNPSDNMEFKVNTFLFPKLLSLNNHRFSYSQCKTTNLTLQDVMQGTNLEGCGRAYAHKVTGLAHAYTFECSFNGGFDINGNFEFYSPSDYEDLGRSLCQSLLDLTDYNPHQKINGQFNNLEFVKNCLLKRLKAEEMRETTRKMMLQKLMNKVSQSSKPVERRNDENPEPGLSGAE